MQDNCHLTGMLDEDIKTLFQITGLTKMNHQTAYRILPTDYLPSSTSSVETDRIKRFVNTFFSPKLQDVHFLYLLQDMRKIFLDFRDHISQTITGWQTNYLSSRNIYADSTKVIDTKHSLGYYMKSVGRFTVESAMIMFDLSMGIFDMRPGTYLHFLHALYFHPSY
jgi:hypothetical protein